jgi:hypothetical protein
VLYVDARTRQPMLDVGTGPRPLAQPSTAPAAPQPAAAPSPWAGRAAAVLSLSSAMGGIAWADVAVPAARPGMLALVSFSGTAPEEVRAAPLATITAAGAVRVGVPLSATLGSVRVAVVVAVASP